MDTAVLAVFNVATNVMYLVSAYVTGFRRVYALSAWFLAACIASVIYHTCDGFGVLCLGGSVSQLRHVDHIVANIAIAQVFLFISTYDIVSLKRARLALNNLMVPLSHTHAVSRLSDHALIKSRFSDMIGAVYVLVVLYASIIAFGTFVEYAVIVGFGLAIVGISYAIHSQLKRRNQLHRWSYTLLAFAAIGVGLSIFLFLLPDDLGRRTHPIWHLTSAVTGVLLILASINHLRTFTVAELFDIYA